MTLKILNNTAKNKNKNLNNTAKNKNKNLNNTAKNKNGGTLSVLTMMTNSYKNAQSALIGVEKPDYNFSPMPVPSNFINETCFKNNIHINNNTIHTFYNVEK